MGYCHKFSRPVFPGCPAIAAEAARRFIFQELNLRTILISVQLNHPKFEVARLEPMAQLVNPKALELRSNTEARKTASNGQNGDFQHASIFVVETASSQQ